MSRPEKKSYILSRHKYSKEDIASATSGLDNHITQLTSTILPRQPYLLSVPSDIPYRHSSRFVNTWYIGTPFDPREEQVQYVSFLPHQAEDESLLRVVGGWSDDQGNFLEEEPSPRTTYESGRNTPLDPSIRKKITLKDYKTKDKSLLEEDQDESTKPAKERVSARTDEERREVDPRSSRIISRSNEPGTATKTIEEKSKIYTKKQEFLSVDGSYQSIPIAESKDMEQSPRPAKRRRLSVSEDHQNLPPPRSPKKGEPSSRKMPKLLSPTLPSPERENGLPQLLSPKLPPSLIKAIATPPRGISADPSNNHQRSDSVRSILASAGLDHSPRPNEKPGTPNGTRVRSDSQQSAENDVAAPGASTPKIVPKVGLKAATPQPSASRSPGPRRRHTIVLKYGKKNRKRVLALLKFEARPKKTVMRSEPLKTPAVQESKPKVTTEAGRLIEKKRPREPSPETLAEKLKPPTTSSVEKRSSTPTMSFSKDHKSPATPAINAPKSVQSTPKQELKSAAMRRVESADGGDPSTPNAKARGSTPLSVERNTASMKTSPGPTSAPSARDDERQAWNKLNVKYFGLGSTIKHEGTSLGSSPAGEASDKDSAKYVILLTEALLCYMINFAAISQARPNVDPGWNTIIPYHIFVFRASRKYPHAHGLVVQLGAVCRQLIHKYDMDRLARDPLPDDQLGSAPTPGSDGNTKTNEDGERYKKKYLEFRDELVRNARELQTAWLDGSRYLSIDVLEREYPKTWAKRARDSSHRGFEKPTPKKIPKEFYLPMDVTTTAFEAIRFSLAFLEEWAEKEGVNWRTRIDL